MSTQEKTFSEMANALRETGKFKVIEKFEGYPVLENFTLSKEVGVGLVVDTETTGAEQHDKLIELGMVSFAYKKETGEVLGVLDVYDGLEDPGIPISEAATKVNGITDEMVTGKMLDTTRVLELLAQADFVIAHNASFDRRFCESRFPEFMDKAWACSLTQIDWAAAGVGSGKLEYLAYRMGFFFEAHRAERDCMALLKVLGEKLPGTDDSILALICQKLNEETHKIWAKGAAFEYKDILRTRGYRWNDGSAPGSEKAWAIEVTADALEQELHWLKVTIFNGRNFTVPVDSINACNRFTSRRTATNRALV